MTGVALTDFQKQFTASAIGSGIASLILSPAVIVKVRLQNNLRIGTAVIKPTILSTVNEIYKTDGVLSFWNGGRTALIQAIPNSVIYMTTYEYLKKELLNRNQQTQSYINTLPALAGALARVVSVTIVSPLELIRTIQASGIDKSILGIVQDIRKQNGILGLYKGWLPTILRDVPYSAIYWYSFESLKPFYHNVFQSMQYTNSVHISTFIAGATSGVISALVTHPFDVLKTQKQLEQINCKDGMNTQIPKTIVNHALKRSGIKVYLEQLWKHKNEQQCCINSRACSTPSPSSYQLLLKLYKEYGIMNGLYRGLSLRLMMVIPGGAVMVTIYEAVKRYL